MNIRRYLEQRVDCLRRRPRADSGDLRGHGYAYSSVAEWVLQHGQEMPRGAGLWAKPELDILCELFERVQLRQGYCFANAQRVVLASIALSRLEPDKNLSYCEGYAWIEGQRAPFAHGWCLLNQRVWDPSLDGHPRREIDYFGTTFPTAYLVPRVFQRGEFGPLVNDWKKQWPLLREPWPGPATLHLATGQSPA